MGNYSNVSDMIIKEKDGEKKNKFFFSFSDFLVNFNVFLSVFADFDQKFERIQARFLFHRVLHIFLH